MLHKCQLTSCNSLAAWESSTAIPPLPVLMGKAEAGEIEPQGCCYVPATSADGISGDGRRDPVVANGSYALGTPRRWVGVCKSLGLRILHSDIKKLRGKEKDRRQFSQVMLSCLCWWKRWTSYLLVPFSASAPGFVCVFFQPLKEVKRGSCKQLSGV